MQTITAARAQLISSEKVRYWSLPVLAGLIALVVRLLIGPWIVDDAYITFRYAANLAEGTGLVYNAGQQVFGSSTPLYVFSLYLANQISGVELPSVALWLNALLDGFSTILIVQLGRRLNLAGALALLAGLVWAFYPLSIRYAVGGMEGSLVACLVLASFYLFLERRDLWAVGIAALAALTRPDALAFAAVLFVLIGWERPKNLVRSALVFALVLLPWIVIATLIYGSPIPQSIIAKSQDVYQADPSINVIQALYFIGGLIAAGPLKIFAEGLYYYPTRPLNLIALLVIFQVVLILWLRGALRAYRMDLRWLAGFGFLVVFLAAYILSGLQGGLMAEWYLVQITPYLILGVFSGIASINFKSRAHQKQVLFGLGLVALQLAGFFWIETPGRSSLKPAAVWVPREDMYQEVADYLAPRLASRDRIAAPEIGALGYYCDCQFWTRWGSFPQKRWPIIQSRKRSL